MTTVPPPEEFYLRFSSEHRTGSDSKQFGSPHHRHYLLLPWALMHDSIDNFMTGNATILIYTSHLKTCLTVDYNE